VQAEWEPDELIDAWTLTGNDWDLIANKAGVTRLGFAVMLKFYEIEGRFPAYPQEVPPAAVSDLGSLVKVDPALGGPSGNSNPRVMIDSKESLRAGEVMARPAGRPGRLQRRGSAGESRIRHLVQPQPGIGEVPAGQVRIQPLGTPDQLAGTVALQASGHVRVVPRLDAAGQRAHLPGSRRLPGPGPRSPTARAGRNTGPVPRPHTERSYLLGSRHASERKSVLTSARDRTTLHQYSQIPGDGDFLPKFLPKQAPPPS
jgi:hypothetical protein